MTLADIRARVEAEFQAILADGHGIEQKVVTALHLGAMTARIKALEDEEKSMHEKVTLSIAAKVQALRDEFKSLTGG